MPPTPAIHPPLTRKVATVGELIAALGDFDPSAPVTLTVEGDADTHGGLLSLVKPSWSHGGLQLVAR